MTESQSHLWRRVNHFYVRESVAFLTWSHRVGHIYGKTPVTFVIIGKKSVAFLTNIQLHLWQRVSHSYDRESVTSVTKSQSLLWQSVSHICDIDSVTFVIESQSLLLQRISHICDIESVTFVTESSSHLRQRISHIYHRDSVTFVAESQSLLWWRVSHIFDRVTGSQSNFYWHLFREFMDIIVNFEQNNTIEFKRRIVIKMIHNQCLWN